MNRSTASQDAAELFRFVLGETHSVEEAFACAMRMFAIGPRGEIERHQPRFVLEAVSEIYAVSVADVLGPRRTGRVARARQVAMSVMHAGGMSLADVGEAMQKSKGAVQTACRHVDRDAKLLDEARDVAAIAARLVGERGRTLPVIFPARGRR